MDWDARIKQVELVVAREEGVSKNIVKQVNHFFHATKIVKEDNLKSLPCLIDLHKSWKERAGI